MDFSINHYRRRPVQPDILKGAAAIAEFLFGAKHRRREVYYLVERDSLPHFKLGSMICARPRLWKPGSRAKSGTVCWRAPGVEARNGVHHKENLDV